jgi:3-hydroxyisobutyrate dehydrogenase-like beta-hydroxyacid dehydrogenase
MIKDRKSIGVLGIGLVGSAITEILLERGYRVHIWNRTAGKMQPLVKKGAIAGESPAAVGNACDRVFISVMSTNAVRELCEGPEGLLSATPPPRYILDTTTGDPDETVALAEKLAAQEVAFLDATISGSSLQIRCREGLYMIGGSRHAYLDCEDLFREVTKNYEYLGPSGSGSKAKLASNVILGLNRLALAEGLVFAEKIGLDIARLLPVLKRSPAYSMAMDVKGEKMVTGDFAPQSRILQHLKDLAIVKQYADEAGQCLPLTEVHLDVMKSAIKAGDGEKDNSIVIEEIRRRRKLYSSGLLK